MVQGRIDELMMKEIRLESYIKQAERIAKARNHNEGDVFWNAEKVLEQLLVQAFEDDEVFEYEEEEEE